MLLNYGKYNQLVEEKRNTLFKNIGARLNPKQCKVIRLAFDVASQAHISQTRKSGEPYIIHPLEVALTINDWKLDEQVIAGALLHDVIEDTEITYYDLEQIFGRNIANLVESVTKLDKLNFESEQVAHAEYYRKVVLSMARDVRVILIKLADRLHNMLTLGSMLPHKRRIIALETIQIYVPIANQIGLESVQAMLANESFKYLYPLRYQVLSKAVADSIQKYSPMMEKFANNMNIFLSANGIVAELIYRPKNVYTLYKWMKNKHHGFTKLYNVFDVKIIVKNIRDCYLTMGVLHNLYKPIPGKFKDYIALPKSNGYQSLHCSLMGPDAIPLQLHIRTLVMDELAENGIISHWASQPSNSEFGTEYHQNNHLINNILEIESNTFSANDFIENLKNDLSPSNVYVFTPQSKIILLPKGSTVLDFAYFIHSDVGNHFAQAYVNQELVKINYRLSSGDTVEIVTKDSIEPEEEWLDYVISGKAINKIKQYFKEQKFDEVVELGGKLLQLGLSLIQPTQLLTAKKLTNLIKQHYPKLTVQELKYRIGTGTLPVLKLVKQLLNLDEHEPVQIKLSNCENVAVVQDINCLVLPGEPAYIELNRKRELVMHQVYCIKSKPPALENLTFALIINDSDKLFATKIHVLLPNAPGMFSQFSSIIAKAGLNMIEVVQPNYVGQNNANIYATISVRDYAQSQHLMQELLTNNFIKPVIENEKDNYVN